MSGDPSTPNPDHFVSSTNRYRHLSRAAVHVGTVQRERSIRLVRRVRRQPEGSIDGDTCLEPREEVDDPVSGELLPVADVLELDIYRLHVWEAATDV